VGKEFRLIDGVITKIPWAQINYGTAETIKVGNAQSLVSLIENLSTNQAVTLGILAKVGKIFSLVTQSRETENSISRTLKHFSHNQGAGWMLLDVDADDLPEDLKNKVKGKGGLLRALLHIFPVLSSVTRVIRGSSSSGVTAPDGKALHKESLHIYILVSDARKIKTYLRHLHEKLWLEGFGHIKTTKAGGLLDRSLVDLAVAGPERLIFEAEPQIQPPLTKSTTFCEWYEGVPLALPEANDSENFKELVSKAKKALKPVADKVKRSSIEKAAIRLTEQQNIPKKIARRIIKSRMEGQILQDDDILTMTNGSSINVAAFLKVTKGTKCMPCPVEGIEYGPTTASFYPANEISPEPRIISFAHGLKTIFHFERYRRLWHLEHIKENKDSIQRIPVAKVANALSAILNSDLETKVIPFLKASTVKREDMPVPQSLYISTVGAGKTHELIKYAGKIISVGCRVLIRVPTVKLGQELCERLNTAFPNSSGLWRGREQADPDNPDRMMCPRYDDTKAAISVGGKATDICGSKKRGYCQFNPLNKQSEEPCGYKQQNLQSSHIVIVAGDVMLQLAPTKKIQRAGSWQPFKVDCIPNQLTLWEPENQALKTKKITITSKSDFDVLILDETNPIAFLEGFDPVNSIDLRQQKFLDLITQKFLKDLLNDLITGLVNCSGEYPDIALFSSMGLDREVLEKVKSALGAAIPAPNGTEHFYKMGGDKILALNREIMKSRRHIINLMKLCDAISLGLKQQVTTLRHIKLIRKSEGSFAHVRLPKGVSRHYSHLPTSIFDATADPKLLRNNFGDLELSSKYAISDGAGVRRYQLRDSNLPYQTIQPTVEGASEKWPARLGLISEWLAKTYETVGLLGPKATIEKLEDQIPPSVLTGHFGALRGTNKFESVGALVIASRPAIPPREAEDIAAVLSGAENTSSLKAGWYLQSPAWIESRTLGLGWPVAHVRHPNSVVEAVRFAVTEANVEQARGRGRNVRRGLEKPLTEYILTSVPLEHQVDATFSYKELKAATSWPMLMLIAGVWVCDGKGTAVIGEILRAILSQTRYSLYKTLIGNSAFESPANWRKDQIERNFEIRRLCDNVDKALSIGAGSAEILFTSFNLSAFQRVKCKVPGARFYATIYVATPPGESPQEVLRQLSGNISFKD
jgi:hypothetical protein